MTRRILLTTAILTAVLLMALGMRALWKHVGSEFITQKLSPQIPVGTVLDRENGVAVRANGDSAYKSHGKNYSSDGYYYGKRWQCVEFVKRYYYDHFKHRMPDGWGHAKSFYDPTVKQGCLNTTRGLVQFQNGGNEPPKPGDLLVYDYGKYGHVAIVSKVRKHTVEIVQQNVKGRPRAVIPLEKTSTGWLLDKGGNVAGWLRMPKAVTSPH